MSIFARVSGRLPGYWDSSSRQAGMLNGDGDSKSCGIKSLKIGNSTVVLGLEGIGIQWCNCMN